MTLCFYVQYSSAWGEQLYLSYTCGHTSKVLPMAYFNESFWWLEIEVATPAAFSYHYILNGLAERHSRHISLQHHPSLTIRDVWIPPGEINNTWLTAPFQQHTPEALPAQAGNCTFRVWSPLTRQPLLLVGNLPELGSWDVRQAIPLHRSAAGYFTANVHLPEGRHVAYKYLRGGGYEPGENRRVVTAAQTLVQDGFTRFPENAPKAAGVAVPVFSLRSESSCGVGEFNDIPLLADWVEATGQRVIQLLPVNDTTVNYSFTDSYPYAVVSAFALHPVYVNVQAVADGITPGSQVVPALPPDYETTRARLNAAPLLDYEAVIRYKMQCLEQLYAHHTASDAFRRWVQENGSWLEPYAMFCSKRDGGRDAAFYHFVQYHLHLQLAHAVDDARSRGIAVKGDLPIGLSLQSVDVAAFPSLFHTGVQAGAPPDEFAVNGQNWGFPTYNWPAMEAEGYAWWKQRLRHMARYFSAFRIDHILGFFRIWQIPRHAVHGILGYFEPALPFSENELQEWGIPFSRERYCEPYITDILLYHIFSTQAVTVKAICLEPSGGGQYRLLPPFRTQAAVLAAGLAPDITEGLLQLLGNVLLIEPEPGRFHPRFNLQLTSSFEALEADVQQRLATLAEHFFYRRHNALWEQEAMKKLPVLQNATNMLVCGEDLGMVPAGVPAVMRRLGILSLEVQHMPKQEGRRPADAPYLSVVTPSTHDMPTLRNWYAGPAADAIREQLRSPAMWCIPQLQDWLALDPSLPKLPPEQERINNPAVMPWYWRYRMPLTLEELLKATGLNALVRQLVRDSGR
ncbi:4-alpha-glucanotransferase [Chitinophaga alhagiae]|uniref:4-alpha-glucanotransferase n=1 Tax=Chitinophaga alhagiae TaxID=2203219 RepID=A0ABM6W8I9_9BACT|nr:4-alpha-glucanotransferase [Chitinophaga alhagiae]AWO00263.1 4-alpha-glucanotransferase [Chitinophaga alhagiae]